MIWRDLKIGRSDRAVLIGQTGSGKTTLARFLVEDPNKRYSVVWDPKGSDSIADWPRLHRRASTFKQLVELAEDEDERRIIYTPHPYVAEDRDDQDQLFSWIYERGNTRFYLDEATCLAHGAYPSRYLTACLQRGRERGVSTLVSTQRPARVPLNILSEAQFYFIFKVLLPVDRKRIEELTGISIEEQTELEEFEFFVWNAWRGRIGNKVKLRLTRGVTDYANDERASRANPSISRRYKTAA